MKYLETVDAPIGSLTAYPGNARRGDIPTIAASLTANGQYRALTVRAVGRKRIILAGNHTWQAARSLGWESIRVETVQCTDAEAARINLVDNRASDLGAYDADALTALLTSLTETGYEGTGYTDEDLAELTSSLTGLGGGTVGEPVHVPKPSPEEFPAFGADIDTAYGCPSCGYEWSGAPKPGRASD